MERLKKNLQERLSTFNTSKVHPYHPSHGTPPPYPNSHLGTEMKEIIPKSSGGKKRTRRVKHRRSKHRKSKSRRH